MEPSSFRRELLSSDVNTGGRTARHVIAIFTVLQCPLFPIILLNYKPSTVVHDDFRCFAAINTSIDTSFFHFHMNDTLATVGVDRLVLQTGLKKSAEIAEDIYKLANSINNIGVRSFKYWYR